MELKRLRSVSLQQQKQLSEAEQHAGQLQEELQQQRAELAAARRQRALELMVQQPQQQLPVGGVSIK